MNRTPLLFSQRTQWSTESNELSRITALLKQDQIPILDLTVSNPTKCLFKYMNEGLLKVFLDPKNLVYEPDAYGLAHTREAICEYYTQKGKK